MKKKNEFPLLYPEINDNRNDIDSDTAIIHTKEYEDSLNLNDPKIKEFFHRLAQNPSKISNEAIPIISKFIKHSKLMQKVEAEYNNEKKQSISVLCNLCAALLQFREIKKGEILFRVNDAGDKFFFLINGKLSLLKPKDINKVKMTYAQYLRYLLSLKKKDEKFFLQETIRKNYDQLPIDSNDELALLYRILFIMTIKAAASQKGFGIEELKEIFNTFEYTYSDFNINQEALGKLWYNKAQKFFNGDSEWERFISKTFKLSISESIFFERYQHLTNDTKDKQWTCSQLEVIFFFGNGAFFGDNALESLEKRRVGSIRAETDSIIAYMKDSDYISLIAPNRKKQKAKEISFLNDNFFLRNISTHLFEKHYYHQFVLHNYVKNYILFQSGSQPRELIFLQEGKVEIRIKCSVVDLHNLIKYLIDEITQLPYFVHGTIRHPPILSKGKIGELKQYLRDRVLTRMKSRAENFIQEMNRIRSFQLFILAPNEVIGIEEMLLKVPYLTTAKVLSVNASFFKLEADNLNKIISEEKATFYSYSKLAANKLVSLIERLFHLKTTAVELTLFKVKQNEESLLNNEFITPSHSYSLTTGLEYSSPKQINAKEKMSLDVLKEEKEKPKTKVSLIKMKRGTRRETSLKHVIFSNPKIAIDTNRGIYSVSSQYTNYDDKINLIKEKESKEDSTFIDFKNKCVSLSKIQQEIDGFSSINESQNIIHVVEQKCNYEMLSSPSKFNYSKNDSNNYQTMEISELVNSNFHMSYVPLLDQKQQSITPYNSPRQFLSPIKYDHITDRSQLKQHSINDTDKIPFISNFKKKSATYSKKPQNKYTTLKSITNQANLKNITLEKISSENRNSNLIPRIVKNYYQGIKKSGYSILANSPHNTLIKKKIKFSEVSARRKRLRVSKSCQELNFNI